MIKWIEVKKQRPKNKQSCYITTLQANYIAGPFPYMEDGDGWLDFCATPEAGEFFQIDDDHPYWWCDEGQINRPFDEELTEDKL